MVVQSVDVLPLSTIARVARLYRYALLYRYNIREDNISSSTVNVIVLIY
jgi:hypothetical protein